MRLQLGFMHDSIKNQLAQQGLEIYMASKTPNKKYEPAYFEKIRSSINLLHLRDYIDIHEYNRCMQRLFDGIAKNVCVVKGYKR